MNQDPILPPIEDMLQHVLTTTAFGPPLILMMAARIEYVSPVMRGFTLHGVL